MRELAILIWLLPYIVSVIILLLKDFSGRLKGLLSVLTILVSALLSTLFSVDVIFSGKIMAISYQWIKSLNVSIGVYLDPLSSIMSMVVTWLSFLIAVYSLEYMKDDTGLTRYWFFFTYFVGSMLLLVLSDNMLAMFVGWEGTGLSSYALIGHWFTDEEDRCVGDIGRRALGIPMWFTPSHAGLRALVFTKLGDIGLLIGIGAIQIAMGGTISFSQMFLNAQVWSSFFAYKGILLAFLSFFILGALAKSAQFPFHEWLVTAMTGPTPISALIHAATMVKAGVYFFLRILPILVAGDIIVSSLGIHDIAIFFEGMALIGSFTAFLMATMAVVSRELKLILAYSTASQLGYMFLGIAAGGLVGSSALGTVAGFSHLISHAVFKACLFLVAGSVIHAVHSRFMDDMGSLSKWMKLTFLSMLLAGLSLSSVPPFMGFWSKDYIITLTAKANAIVPLSFAVFTAFLTPLYTFRMIARVFDYKPSKRVQEIRRGHEAKLLMLIPYLILALATIVIGAVWPLISNNFAKLFGASIEELEPGIGLSATTLTFVTIGLALPIYVYSYKRADTMEYVNGSKLLKDTHSFLYDRWYFNSIYYKFVGLFYDLSKIFKSYIEDVMDSALHIKLVTGFMKSSKALTKIQTGLLNQYALLFWIGVGLTIIIIFILGGVVP